MDGTVGTWHGSIRVVSGTSRTIEAFLDGMMDNGCGVNSHRFVCRVLHGVSRFLEPFRQAQQSARQPFQPIRE